MESLLFWFKRNQLKQFPSPDAFMEPSCGRVLDMSHLDLALGQTILLGRLYLLACLGASCGFPLTCWTVAGSAASVTCSLISSIDTSWMDHIITTTSNYKHWETWLHVVAANLPFQTSTNACERTKNQQFKRKCEGYKEGAEWILNCFHLC